MAARPLLIGLRAVARSPLAPTMMLRESTRAIAHLAAPSITTTRLRRFHNTSYAAAAVAVGTGQGTTPVETAPLPGAPEPFDAKNAAFLGEADSDDGFEAAREINPPKIESLDARNAAFLGEADSDDGFEAESEINPRKVESVDATSSAYLGEADSDDGFEAHKLENPTDHGPIDPESSAFHGQPGEHDH